MQLAALAEHYGVTLLIETNGIWCDSEKLAGLLQAVNSKHLGALWDVHHPYRFLGESPQVTAGNLRPWIGHTHLKDSQKTADGYRYALPGFGDVPLEGVVHALKAIDYDGFYSLEWVKRWDTTLEEPGIVFAHFAKLYAHLYLIPPRRFYRKGQLPVFIEKRYIKRIEAIFAGLSVPMRLLDAQGYPVVPEDGERRTLPAMVMTPGITHMLGKEYFRALDLNPQLFLCCDAGAAGAEDLLKLADAMLMSMLKSSLSIASQSDVLRRALRQDEIGAALAARRQRTPDSHGYGTLRAAVPAGKHRQDERLRHTGRADSPDRNRCSGRNEPA